MNIVVFHDANPEKYFEALAQASAKTDSSLRYIEASTLKRFLARIVKRESSILEASLVLLLGVCAKLRLLFYGCDILVVGLPPYDFRLCYCALIRAREVIYHNSWPCWEDHARAPRKYLFAGIILRRYWRGFFSRRVRAVVSVTESSRKSIQREFPMVSSMHLVPHCLSKEFYETVPVQRDFDFLDADASCNVLFIGQVAKHKGIDTVLGLAECSTLQGRLSITIAGTGPERERVERATKNNRVKYAGALSDRFAVSELMDSNDILLVPSIRSPKWEEVFGMVVIEGLSRQMLVIASDHVGPREILSLDTGKCGLLIADKSGIEKWEQTLLAILNCELEDLNIICERGFQRAMDFRLEEAEKQWARIIKV